VSIGVNERNPAGSTLYNTQLYPGPDGAVAAKHRKLMPTGGERLVWGMGDGSTLAVVDTRRQVPTTQQDPAADGSPADHPAAAGPRPDHGGANHAR